MRCRPVEQYARLRWHSFEFFELTNSRVVINPMYNLTRAFYDP